MNLKKERTFDDFDTIAEKLTFGKVEPHKLVNYGCHCFNTGERPQSDMSKGPPVDEIDRACMNYKVTRRSLRAVNLPNSSTAWHAADSISMIIIAFQS